MDSNFILNRDHTFLHEKTRIVCGRSKQKFLLIVKICLRDNYKKKTVWFATKPGFHIKLFQTC